MAENTPFFVDREVILLTRNGIWLADGTEITHEPTRRLFAKSLKKDEKGYFLQVGRETKRIEVEDTAYFIHRIDGDPQVGFKLTINDETQETLDPGTLTYKPGRLTCRIKGNPGEEAKFLHSAYFDLLKDLQEDSKSYFLNFGGKDRIRITLSGK